MGRSRSGRCVWLSGCFLGALIGEDLPAVWVDAVDVGAARSGKQKLVDRLLPLLQGNRLEGSLCSLDTGVGQANLFDLFLREHLRGVLLLLCFFLRCLRRKKVGEAVGDLLVELAVVVVILAVDKDVDLRRRRQIALAVHCADEGIEGGVQLEIV